MPLEEKFCPLCGLAAVIVFTDHDAYRIDCQCCGTFSIVRTLWSILDVSHISDDDIRLFYYLPSYTRQTSESGTTAVLDTNNWRECARRHLSTSIAQKVKKCLELIAERAGSYGNDVDITSNLDYPLVDVSSAEAMEALLNELQKKDYLSCRASSGRLTCSLTIAGWEYLDQPATAANMEKSQGIHLSISDAIIQGNVVGNVSGANAEVQYTSHALAAMATSAPTPSTEEREGTIRSAITEQIEVLRYTPGGPVVLYGDLTKRVPQTFLTEEIVRVIEQMRLDGIVDFDGPLAPHSTVIRLLPQWNSVQNPQLQRLLVTSEHALASGDLITSMAGTKFAFDEIVAAICAEYEDVAGSKNSSSFQSFLFATERLGLSRVDSRKCREMTSDFRLSIAYSGNWRLARLSDKTDEDYRREMTFVLGFLAKFIPLAQDVYPDAMQNIHVRILLPEQPR